MPRMTQAEYIAFLSRHFRGGVATAHPGTDKEAELHSQIIGECKVRGWIAFHGSMAHQTHRTPGEPDFVILAPGGRTYLIECKAGRGKLSTDQRAIAAWAAKLGHTVHVVRSIKDFLSVLEPTDNPPKEPAVE